MEENLYFFEKNYDGGLRKAAENFEDEINVTNKENKEEAKTVEETHFVELWEDNKIYIKKQINKPKPCIIYTVVKHLGLLRTLEK